MKRIFPVLIGAFLAAVLCGTVSAVPANEGATNSYDLALQALKGKDSVTDLYVKITPKANDMPPPDISRKSSLSPTI